MLSFERRLPKNNRFSFMFEKSENSGFSEYLKLDRDKSTFKSHRDFCF